MRRHLEGEVEPRGERMIESLERGFTIAARDVRRAPRKEPRGFVVSAAGSLVEARVPAARIGDGCVFDCGVRGEIVAFKSGLARVLVLGTASGLGPGTGIRACGGLKVRAGAPLLGRVVGADGQPIDGGPPLEESGAIETIPLERPAPDPLRRRPIRTRLVTGVRAIDALCPMGRGQRIGLFAGPGVGKSTLLGDLAAGAAVDVVVAALIGERGREVKEILEGPLAAAKDRSVVVVAPGDSPPLARARATVTATAIAEHFRGCGASVLLLVDSLTRYARALREIGLAAGEAPARGGFPPSVLASLPKIIERAGPDEEGEITAIYTVLCEEEGATDALADEVRGLVDGHLILARHLAERDHWPAIDIPASISRVARDVASETELTAAAVVRRRIAAYEERRDLVVLGAYQRGDAEADAAVESWPRIEAFLKQRAGTHAPFAETAKALESLSGVSQ